jgi:hypothetical protein
MTKLQELQALVADGQFHHATYRNLGTIWEGLWIYRNYDGLRGFEPCMCFPKGDADLDRAYEELRGTGISLGAYGQG